MSSELELYDARLSYVQVTDEKADIHFSYAYIHKLKGLSGREVGRGWSQEAVLMLKGARLPASLPPLPNTVMEGYLEVKGEVFELIPLPFDQEGPCHLHLEFADGNELDAYGEDPMIQLRGAKVFLEDFT